jgi:hypothetical protein
MRKIILILFSIFIFSTNVFAWENSDWNTFEKAISGESGPFLLRDGTLSLTNNWDAGSNKITAETFASDVATGTAPLTVASTTVVSNLNADTLDGVNSTDFVKADGTISLTTNWDAGSYKITAETFESDIATGTAPLTVASTTVVTNLNSDTLDGEEAAAFVKRDGTTALTASWDIGPFDLTSRFQFCDRLTIGDSVLSPFEFALHLPGYTGGLDSPTEYFAGTVWGSGGAVFFGNTDDNDQAALYFIGTAGSAPNQAPVQFFADKRGLTLADSDPAFAFGPGLDNRKLFILGGGNIGINEAAPATAIEITRTEPYVTLHNSTHEDTDGGRESEIRAKGEQSGGEETTLGRVYFAHDGTADTENGFFAIDINDGNDGDSPTQAFKINSTSAIFNDSVEIVNTVYVDASGNGLPAASGGVITLEDNTKYIFPGANVNINLTDILEFGQDSIIEEARITTTQTIRSNATDGEIQIRSSVLINASAGTLITIPDNGIASRLIEVNIVSPAGKAFDFDSDTPNSTVLMNGVVVVSAANLGDIDDVTLGMFQCQFFTFTNGFVFSDLLSLSINSIEMNTASATTYLDFQGSTQGNMQITAFSPTLNTSSQYAFDFNTGITYGGTTVSNCPVKISGSATKDNIFASGSNDNSTVGFKFTGNTNIADSTVSGEFLSTGNSSDTLIPVLGAWAITDVVTSYTNDEVERLNLIAADSLVEYLGLEDAVLLGDANINFEPDSGTSKKLAARFFTLENEEFSVTFTNGTNIVNEVGHGLSNGDIICFRDTAGTLPAELREDILYYIVNAGVDDFQVSYTSGGAAVAFTDDGTPPNEYKIINLHGSVPSNVITNGSPRDVVPHALMAVSTNDKIGIAVSHTAATPLIDVTVIDIYIRIAKS